MNQPRCDLEFAAIVAVLEPFAARVAHEAAGETDIQRIASAVFCSNRIDPSIIAFAVRRTARHWGRAEDEVDVAVTVALLSSAARVMDNLRPLDTRR